MKPIDTLYRKVGDKSKSLRTSIVALVCAIIVGGVIIAIAGYSPIETYLAMFKGSLGSRKGIVLSLTQATPLIFTGLSFAIAYRVKLVNLGAEGQLYMGAMAAAIVGYSLTGLPAPLHIAITLLISALVGGLVGLFIGYLRIRFGAREVITSIMLNEIIILFTSFLAAGPLKGENSVTVQTERILTTALLPVLAKQSQLTIAFILAVLIAIMLQVLLNKTVVGYEMRVTGFSRRAAETGGIKVWKIYLLTIFISGAVAGLGGASQVMGVNKRFVEGFSASYGFAGISVAALAVYNPVAVVFSGIIFGILKAGAMTVSRTTAIPVEFVSVIQSLVVVFMAAPNLITDNLARIGRLWKKLFSSTRKLIIPAKSGDRGGFHG